ncbi:MAG: SCP2 sterol-binding domain-containing protein [Chloroflexi bacterium]|nr:SCP2 sterol-binding domain-containing protein [Chloroflexota bacterium]MBM3165995.1 SCP2 sterol-binding domain-containing protein [Chloroflexota bacterium]MBM3176360.1 SCP2 sterol-binding domain-containing protein [Chloroflexota bacterium]MBM3183080.1 SCP2 sterol-binding domain-containing protein [Chloroflexota bacterium]MBM4454175.1 SCP2 sterol-binding domain-containing protein [Chloroflexota bacterium]
MPEVKVKKGQELNGLGTMLKEIMDTNLKDPKKYKSIEKLKGSMVVKESTSGVAITLHLKEGELELQNDAVEKPTAFMEAGFENLAYISSGQLSPIMAMLTGKLKAGGNPLMLLKVANITVLK